DISIIDPKRRIEVDHAAMETNADWSPYQGWPLGGFAETTFSRGRKIVADYAFVGESGWGRWLPRERAGSLPSPCEEPGRFRAGERLSDHELQARFADIPPPLGLDEARAEAARCLFCDDAPCTRACPTHIDVPRFIRQILHRDELGAAATILEANIFGGS